MKSIGRVVLSAVLALSLAACGSEESPGPGSSSEPSTPAAQAATTKAAEPFVMDIGMEYDRCGIGISVVFIARTASSGRNDVEPVIYGGEISKMKDTVSSLIGTDPMPSNAAKAVPGTDISIMNKQFRVSAVDAAKKQVTVQPLCA